MSATPTNRLADDLFALLAPPVKNGRTPTLPVEVWETDEAYVVLADVPGIDPESLEVTLHKDLLTLRGERTRPELEGRLRLSERTFTGFERTLRFAMPIDSERVEAETKNGVLTIRVLKAEEAKPRKIEIKTE